MVRQHTGWIGVDLDGTLARYAGWKNGEIGDPVPAMLDRVKDMLAAGIDVRIVTARAAGKAEPGVWPQLDTVAVARIQDWTEKHLGKRLPVQFWKDFSMIELWDDRAVQVMLNEGVPVVEHACEALKVAEQLYMLAAQNNWQIPRERWENLRSALGIPEPEEASRLILPGALTSPLVPRT